MYFTAKSMRASAIRSRTFWTPLTLPLASPSLRKKMPRPSSVPASFAAPIALAQVVCAPMPSVHRAST
jgi:hypothetical protein